MLHGYSVVMSADLPHARLPAVYEECDRERGIVWLIFTIVTNHLIAHLSSAGACGNEYKSSSLFSCLFRCTVYFTATAFCNADHWLHFAAAAEGTMAKHEKNK